MTWEHGRQLSSLQTAENSVGYKYDSNGMRTQKDVDGTKTYYYYDSDKNLIGLTKGNATLLFYYGSDGNATSFKYNGTMYYYIKNLQGDIVKIIDQSDTEVAGYVYDAWGNIRSTTGNEAISSLNPFRYRGYVYDNESKLYYLQSRYYDPFVGRFLNADETMVLLLSSLADDDFKINLTNLFSYCYNNPITFKDNNGYIALVDDAVVLALIGFIAITCVLCVWMSTPQFRQAWTNFCNAVGNGLSSIWSTICNGASSVWNWSTSKIKNATTAIKKFNTAVKADNKIKSKVKKNSKTRYWSATLNKDHVDIGKTLTFSQAKSYVKNGKSVFTVTKSEEKALAKSAYGGKKPVGPEIDKGKNGVIGYYWHFHVYGRKNKAHVWYLFN